MYLEFIVHHIIAHFFTFKLLFVKKKGFNTNKCGHMTELATTIRVCGVAPVKAPFLCNIQTCIQSFYFYW